MAHQWRRASVALRPRHDARPRVILAVGLAITIVGLVAVLSTSGFRW